MKTLKITFVTPFPNLSGGIRVITTYADYLANQGHTVNILFSKKQYSLKDRILYLIKLDFLKETQSHFSSLNTDKITIKAFDSSNVDSSRFPDADLLIGTWWETIEWVSNLHVSKGILVHFIQDHELFKDESVDRVKAIYHLETKKIVVSRWLKILFENEYKSNNIKLVPNAVDSNQFNGKNRTKNATMFRVGFLYSSAKRKNSTKAILAYKNFNKTSKIRSQLIGFGSHNIVDVEYEKIIGKYYYRPSQSEIVKIYRSCDVWLFCSDNEGFGLPILESMACGTPVIAVPSSAAPDILSNGGGVLLDDKSVESISNALTELSEMDNTTWTKLSNRALEIAKSYSWYDAGKNFELCLHEFLDE